MIAVGNKRNLHIVFYQRDVPDEMWTPWKLPVDVVSKSFQDADHDASWWGLLNEYSERLLSSLKAHSTSTSMKVSELTDFDNR